MPDFIDNFHNPSAVIEQAVSIEIDNAVLALRDRLSKLDNGEQKRILALAITDLQSAQNWLRRIY